MIWRVTGTWALGVLFSMMVAAQPPTDPGPYLQEQLEREGTAEWLVVFSEQADLGKARHLADKTGKGHYVYRQLRDQAARSQAEAVQLLQAAGAPFQSFWIVNALWVRGDAELAGRLQELPGVMALVPNPQVRLEAPRPSATASTARQDIEWGIQKIRADEVWALGYRGQGVVVAGQDTGYEWDHPALKNQYRGWDGSTADHNYHWHDAIHELHPLNNDTTDHPMNNPCGLDSPVPCDDNNHGTHTMGTVVGDDGQDNQIGVAPGAQWISCRNMERGWGKLSTYLECFQWFLAPTDLQDENPDPARAPDVINNSWRCPEIEGCTPANWALMEQAIQSLRAAGIVVVASAGNEGSNCHTVNAPPALFAGSFSVGATRPNDTIAGFSSRGPVLADSSFRIKPNVAAPGVGVRSSIRHQGYASFSGTSMAGPHVAGVVALVLSANPGLRGEVEVIESLIEQTARPMLSEQDCGGVSGQSLPNAVYGYGRVDALAAVERALEVTHTQQPARSASLRVFPNPARDQIVLTGKDVAGKVRFRLFSASGQVLESRQWETPGGEWQHVLRLPFPAGLYLYRLDTAEGGFQGKLILH